MLERYTTYWILFGTELGPEGPLVSNVESGGNVAVGLLENDVPETTDAVCLVEFARGISSEGSAPNPSLAHLLDDIAENVLSNQRRSGQSSVWAANHSISLTSMAPRGAPGKSNAHLIWNPCEADN